jgi:Cof subfamily protein (haloacid dehalogenase superfamily)
MKYRALAIDLDGTLLVGEDVPEPNAHLLREADAAGLHVIIATARWRQMARRVEEHIGISGPAITCSGAQVYAPDVGRDVFDERLPRDFTEELYALCDSDRCVATVTVEDRTLLKLDGHPDPSLVPEEMHWVPALTGADPSLPRVAAIQGTKVNERIRAELQPKYRGRVHFFDSIGPTGKVILTLTSAKASKGDALRAACAHLGITPAQVVAFGDSENDIEMFKVAGASVAMGQADERTKAAATTVTGRNDEAGVALMVERLLRTGDIL